jgi:hypothetical protein
MTKMKPVECLACSGTGKSSCNVCKGKGRVGGFLGIGGRPCGICEGNGMTTCRDCGGSGEDVSPVAGLRSNDLETRRRAVESLGLSDDVQAFLALRRFRDKGGVLIEPIHDEVQTALRRIRERALGHAPKIIQGMSADQVVSLLGPPISGQSGAEILGSFGRVMGSAEAISAISARGYYMFRHPAGDYGLVMSDGRVQSVHTFPYV